MIITNNGKPSALMIEIDDENLEDVLASVRQSMAMRAVNKLRLASTQNHSSELLTEEIDDEIAKVHKDKNNDKSCNRH